MTPAGWIALPLLLAGVLFFVAGTVALLRFPDVHSRLHALTKADNLGLGLVVLGLVPLSGSVAEALQMVLVWILVLVASAVSSRLMAQASDRPDAGSRARGGEGAAAPPREDRA